MTLMILLGANAFTQLLGFTGALHGVTNFVAGLQLPAILIHIAMLTLIVCMGTLIDAVSQIMLTVPVYFPVITALGMDPLWFALTMLMTFEIGSTSPPFGMSLFVIKGVAPPDVTMGEIYRAALPFIYCDIVSIALVISFPILALWLPSMM